MIIQKIEIRGEGKIRSETFENGVNLVYSTGNSVGKTSFIRLILHALGYMIPGTRLLDFSNIETKIDFERDGESYTVFRKNNSIDITNNKILSSYELPGEQRVVLRKVWGNYDHRILDNILGCIYLDQEKGWTLLNKGKVIGGISFSLEELVRGLSNTDSKDLETEIHSLNKELKKYKHMQSFRDYQDEVQIEATEIKQSDYDEKLLRDLELERIKKSSKQEDLKRINQLIDENGIFIKFIEDFRISVKSSSGDIIPVNKETILNYPDNLNFLLTKKIMIRQELNNVSNSISTLEKEYDDYMRTYGLKTEADIFNYNIQKISVNQLEVNKIITGLEKEKRKKTLKLRNLTIKDNSIIDEIYDEIMKYIFEFKLERFFEKYKSKNREQLIFSSDLKSLSGTVLHLIVFCYKIAYINVLKNNLKIKFPIILDSPSGREVTSGHIEKMMQILGRDFSDHQIIISSIHNDYFEAMNIITLENKLLNNIDDSIQMKLF
ncbi:hypothetical protein PT126_03400 [Erysipelothrix rhusiopathiae]|nr:hypothetical protein [Erysipelothrix rhusiopathiae]MDE8193152.1 hypothetical protein [Erysipelothrix rhusiopathiae]